jgi:hypothetical protein
MLNKGMAKAAYEDRSDLEKIQSQWHKLTGLHTREEWSAAIVRAATAAELAANFAIREEFRSRGKFDAKFVDSLLRWANGLAGKMDHLLLPLNAGKKRSGEIKKLKARPAKFTANEMLSPIRASFPTKMKRWQLLSKRGSLLRLSCNCMSQSSCSRIKSRATIKFLVGVKMQGLEDDSYRC